MACRKQKHLKQLIEIFVNDSLFKEDLPLNAFKAFLEILRNAKKKTFEACFSKDTRKRLKKHKKTVKCLLSSSKSLKKRKKLFIRASKKFQSTIYDALIPDFIENCVSSS